MPPESLRRVLLRKRIQIEPPEDVEGACPRLGARSSEDLQADRDVVADPPPRKQEVLLKHVAEVALAIRYRDSIDENAPGGRLLEPRDDVQNRTLAAAAGPDDGEEFCGIHREIHAFDRTHRVLVGVLVKHLGDVRERHALAGFG